jgi:hypothetical protein
LPHNIKVDISGLNTFEDSILVKDIILPGNIKVMDNLEETVVKVMEPEKAEEELAKPVAEEGLENIEKVEKKKKEEAGEGKETK